MRQSSASAAFSIRPAKLGPGWRVVIELPTNSVQYIGGFETEQEAADWVKHQSGDWIKSMSAART